MWNDIGGVALFVAIIGVVLLGGASLYRGMFVRGRQTSQGEDVEDLMFHEEHVRRMNQAAGMPSTPRWWRRAGRRGPV